MKKLLLFSAFVMLAFSSCSKKKDNSPSTGTNTITASVAGTDTKFNTAVYGLIQSGNGLYDLIVAGITGSSAQGGISITIGSPNPITKGTYTYNSSTSPDATSFPDLIYNANASSSEVFTTDISGTNATTITITSISSTNVQGTFSGVLLSSKDGTTTKSVTDGKFNVNITTK